MAVRPDITSKNAAPLPRDAEEDLEQYGVWVKAEPQDIIEEPEAVSFSSSDFDSPSELSTLQEESFLTEDEEKLLGSFEELDAAAEAAPHTSEDSIDQFEMESSSIPDIENLPPLEDFEVKDDSNSDIEELGAATIDISLDDLEAPAAFGPDAKLDISNIRGLGEDSETYDFSPSAPSSGPSAIEDVSAEFLDFADSSSGSPEGGSDVTSEFLDSDSSASGLGRQSEPEPDFEPIDMELHFDDTLTTEASGSSSGEPGFEAVSEFDDFLKEDEVASKSMASSFAPSRFDDVAAVEKELSEPILPSPSPRHKASQEPAPDASLSNDLLLKIAEELSSIRSELVTLKSQFGALKPEAGTVVASTPSPGGGQRKPKPAGGFFDEEEDETIALTGDELDNILNTADFTEETPGEAQEAMDLDLGSVDSDNESILPESGDYQAAAQKPGIEEIRLEPSADVSALGLDSEAFTDIDMMVDEGIQHLTQAPEDTSYLEEPLPGEEPLDLAEIPLHEESLVESGHLDMNIDIEEIEPLAEISEELPVVEGSFESEAAPETLADITLGMDAVADYMPETVFEAEALESIPEIDEGGFEDINLAEESPEDLIEEVEELSGVEEDLTPFSMQTVEDSDLAAKIAEKTVKPSQPISVHPDEISMSLDDSFFVGGPSDIAEAETAEEIVEAPAMVTPHKPKVAEPPKGKASAKDFENDKLKSEIRDVLSYLDKLLESLPDSKIDEFAKSEYFDTYKKLFEELGLV